MTKHKTSSDLSAVELFQREQQGGWPRLFTTDCWDVFSDKHWLSSLEGATRKVTNLTQLNSRLSAHTHTHSTRTAPGQHTEWWCPCTWAKCTLLEGGGFTTKRSLWKNEGEHKPQMARTTCSHCFPPPPRPGGASVCIYNPTLAAVKRDLKNIKGQSHFPLAVDISLFDPF